MVVPTSLEAELRVWSDGVGEGPSDSGEGLEGDFGVGLEMRSGDLGVGLEARSDDSGAGLIGDVGVAAGGTGVGDVGVGAESEVGVGAESEVGVGLEWAGPGDMGVGVRAGESFNEDDLGGAGGISSTSITPSPPPSTDTSVRRGSLDPPRGRGSDPSSRELDPSRGHGMLDPSSPDPTRGLDPSCGRDTPASWGRGNPTREVCMLSRCMYSLSESSDDAEWCPSP